jgi:hypothetical protein
MDKIDFKKELKSLYNASAKAPSLVEVPEMNYLMVSGKGTPSDQDFEDAANTIYPLAYTLKFMVRETLNIDYGVMPMELVWEVNREKKGDFHFTMMIMQPQYITKDLFESAYEKVRNKFNPPLLEKVRFEGLSEGLCIQMMHKGDYNKMNTTLEKMLQFVSEQGYTSNRDTHDIYLNNALKTKKENLKTIMRLMVRR